MLYYPNTSERIFSWSIWYRLVLWIRILTSHPNSLLISSGIIARWIQPRLRGQTISSEQLQDRPRLFALLFSCLGDRGVSNNRVKCGDSHFVISTSDLLNLIDIVSFLSIQPCNNEWTLIWKRRGTKFTVFGTSLIRMCRGGWGAR